MLPTFQGMRQDPRTFLYREFAGYGGWQAAWVGNFKLVRKQLQKPEKTTTELYDLAKDPGEQDDLAKAEPQRVQAIEVVFRTEHVPSATFPLAAIDGK
jgi:arylsulfatase A